MEIPRFNFANSSIKTAAELDTADKGKGVDKFFKPGKYDVKIESVEVVGACKNDPTWCDVKVQYRGTGEKTIRDFLMVPTSDIKYGSKGVLMPFRRLQAFAGALGHDLQPENVGDVLKALFANPTKLIGHTVAIEVGYRKGYIHYTGKNEAGEKKYVIMTAEGSVLRDPATLQTVEFADFDAAKAYAVENKLPVSFFCDVVGVARSAAATTTASSIPW